jgi:hypothetical protein
MKQNPAYWICSGILMNAFLLLGYSGDGGLHRVALVFGGVWAGHLLTEMLNYNEEEANERN